MQEIEEEFKQRVIADIKNRCSDLCYGFVFEYDEENQLNFYVPARKTLTHFIMNDTAFTDEDYEHDMADLIARLKHHREQQKYITNLKNRIVWKSHGIGIF